MTNLVLKFENSFCSSCSVESSLFMHAFHWEMFPFEDLFLILLDSSFWIDWLTTGNSSTSRNSTVFIGAIKNHIPIVANCNVQLSVQCWEGSAGKISVDSKWTHRSVYSNIKDLLKSGQNEFYCFWSFSNPKHNGNPVAFLLLFSWSGPHWRVKIALKIGRER